MAYFALIHNIVHQNQAGALLKRSAIDLAAALIRDVELEWVKGNYVTMVNVDVQGAFDAILRNRMATWLYLQGWPVNLVRWIHGFLLGRRVSIRLQDIVTELWKLLCGRPQGSPLSPIQRFGYADDMAMLLSAPALKETTSTETHRIICTLKESQFQPE